MQRARQTSQLLRSLLAACETCCRSGQIHLTKQPCSLDVVQQHSSSIRQQLNRLSTVQQQHASEIPGWPAQQHPRLSALAQQPQRQLHLLQQHPSASRWAYQLPGQRGMATRTEQQQAANPGLRFWKPTSPGQRFRVTVRRTGIWKGRPLRQLTQGTSRIGGRNAYGRITIRHRGGGAKRKLRMVDFQRKLAAEGVVERLEYDPNRTGYIALVKYATGRTPQAPQYSYVLAPQDLNPGDSIKSGSGVPIKPGNVLPLKDIPVGMPINCIELKPDMGGVLCRAAGCMAAIVNKQKEYAIVRLPSGEQRLIDLRCRATIGAVSNPQNRNRVLGKAGASRHLGIRPTVRGVAMNPVDHPHGGGTAGGRPSCSPWGLLAKGFKTRNKKKQSNKYILSPRSSRKKNK